VAATAARRETADGAQVRRISVADVELELAAFFGPADDEVGAGGAPAALGPAAEDRVSPFGVAGVALLVGGTGRLTVSRNFEQIVSIL